MESRRGINVLFIGSNRSENCRIINHLEESNRIRDAATRCSQQCERMRFVGTNRNRIMSGDYRAVDFPTAIEAAAPVESFIVDLTIAIPSC